MGKVEDSMNKALELAAMLQPNARGQSAQMKRRITPPAENLSDVDESGLVLPHNYRNHYEWLKENKPDEAVAFWEKWAYDPRPKVEDRHKLARTMLERQGQANELKRRI